MMDWTSIQEQANELFKRLHELHYEFYILWKDNVLLTWRWWIAVALIVLPWALWFIVKKKESMDRLLYAGFFVMLASSFLDVIGIALGLWTYPANVFPLMPEFIPFDISALPVATMLFIQFFPRVKAIYKALVYSTVGAFVFQPVMHWIGLYDMLGWKNYYSFPMLIATYMAANFFATRNRFDKI